MTEEAKLIATQILEVIKGAKKILLHCHPNPDPDSVGSALGLYHALKALGKEPTVIKGDSPMPEYLSFLPGYETIVPKSYLEINPSDFDLFIVLDVSQVSRVSVLGEVKFPPTMRTILIDHHQSAEPFCQINLVLSDYPATAQILYELFKLWNLPLTESIASCLFLGMYTDTGGFKYPSTRSSTLLAAAELTTAAPNFSKLIHELENNNNPGQLRFEGLAMSSIEVVGQGKVGLVALSAEQIKAAGLRSEDTRGISIPNRLKSVRG
ncbi:MAG: bifunctional oligoribonuclease/PAP phosphatase NrnA, partial [Patescibacteria group bacterium]